MRRNFYKLLSERSFDAKKEYAALWKLFCVEQCNTSAFSPYPMVAWINDKYFRDLPFRGSFVSLEDMMDELGIQARSAVNIDKLFLFCELLYAVLPGRGMTKDPKIINLKNTILQNIGYILEHTNHEFAKDPNGNTIIVEKNKAATLASQLANDDVVAFELIEYNHFALKGDLEGKKRLLFSIAAYIEPILKSKVLQNNGYKQLESDAGFLFNNFHIRHNNKVGSKAQDYITTVKDPDLEEWYDKAYELALSVIIINDYLTIKQDIVDIKSKYTWRS